MHRLMFASVALLVLGCGDDSMMSETEPGTSGGSAGSTAASSGASPTTMGSDPTETSVDSSGQPPGTSTTDSPPTTTDTPGDSTGDTDRPPEATVLQNDSWTPADGLVWQMWPGPNDCWASTFSADAGLYPFEITGAVAAVGNGAGVFSFEVGVWEVDGEGMPVNELGSVSADIDGGASSLAEVDLTGLGLPAVEDGDFALVMCHTEHMGFPSIAIDSDGTVDAARNWVYQQSIGNWVASPLFFGTDGDFILRAAIMPM